MTDVEQLIRDGKAVVAGMRLTDAHVKLAEASTTLMEIGMREEAEQVLRVVMYALRPVEDKVTSIVNEVSERRGYNVRIDN